MSRVFKFFLIISLFLPLWICVTIVYFFSIIDNYQNIQNYTINVQDWICIGGVIFLLVFSIISIAWCLSKVRKISKRNYNQSTYVVCDIVKMKNYTTDFLATFILPFFAFYTGLSGTYTQVGVFIVCLIYSSSVAILYFKNKILFTNVIFELFKYSFYEVKTTRGTLLVLSKKELSFDEE